MFEKKSRQLKKYVFLCNRFCGTYILIEYIINEE